VFYKPLTRENIGSIIDLLIQDLQKRLNQKQITLNITPAAKDYIAQNAYDPVYGARPLKRFIQSHVETLIGRMIIADEIGPDSVVTLDSDGEQLTVK